MGKVTEKKQKSWEGPSGRPFDEACDLCRKRKPHTFAEHRGELACAKIDRYRALGR